MFFFLLSCAPKEDTNEPERPNIIFIMSDDHAYQAISAYSDHLTQTPNIDRLAKEGMLFTNACVTNSICAPARAVLLTGKHAHKNGKLDNLFAFDTTQVTFPQLLQAAGYQTAMFGKLHFGNNPKGFDEFKILDGQGTYFQPTFFTKNEGTIQVKGYATDIITDMTLNWLEHERKQDQPFLLMYLHKAPHRHWMPAPRHQASYLSKTYPEPASLFDDYAGRGTAAKSATMNLRKHMNWAGDSKIYPEVMDRLGLKSYLPSDKHILTESFKRMSSEDLATWHKNYRPMNEAFEQAYPSMNEKDLMRWRYQRYMQDYLATIAAVDEGVGKVLDYLDEKKLAENTLVVYTSDQGFYLGEHGWFDKRFAYNESFKTPLLIRWPHTIKPGITNEEMVQNLDFAQTFLELAGVEAPSDMQGESLVPVFQGKAEKVRDAAYYHYYEYPSEHDVKRHYAIITPQYKLIHFYHDIDEWELYDRIKDPQEMKNVYNDPAYKEIRAQMHKDLIELRAYYGDSEENDVYFLEEYLRRKGGV